MARHNFVGYGPYLDRAAADSGLGPEAADRARKLKPLDQVGELLGQAVEHPSEAAVAGVYAAAVDAHAILEVAVLASRRMLADVGGALGLEPPDDPGTAAAAADLRRQLAEREAAFLTERDRANAVHAEHEARQEEARAIWKRQEEEAAGLQAALDASQKQVAQLEDLLAQATEPPKAKPGA